MPNIIDIDVVVDNHDHNYNRPSSRNSSSTFNSNNNNNNSNAKNNANATAPMSMSTSMPFIMMLGDYSEKEYFVPSTNVIRNEILEGVSCSEVDGGGSSDGSCKLATTGKGIAFRCIYCKHVKDPVEMSIIRPQNLASIRESVVRFQQTHVQQCTYIPSDIRTCYLNFKSQEESFAASSSSTDMRSTATVAGSTNTGISASTSSSSSDDEEHVWVSSAIRRGLRDVESSRSSGSGSGGSRNQGGGILYCPELAVQELEPSRQRVVGYHPPNPTPPSSSSSLLSLSSESIVSNHEEEEPRPNDVLIGRGGLAVKHPGNIYWRQLMKEVKSDYLDCHRRSKHKHHQQQQQQQPGNTLTTNNNIDIDNNNGSSKSKKSILTRLVVEAIRNQSPTPGRFLFQDKVTGKWNDIGDKEAMKKTRQALRDMGKQARLQQKHQQHHQQYHPQQHVVGRNDVRGDVVAASTLIPSSSSSTFEYDTATTTAAMLATSTKVKSESKKRTNNGLMTVKPHTDVIVVGNATTTTAQETNEAWEITNLFNEEIGEWIDTTTDEPSTLPPTKKKQKIESTTSKSNNNNNTSVTVLDKSSNNNEVDCWKMLQETLTDIASFHNHDRTIATKENKPPNNITNTTINTNNNNNNNASSSVSSKYNNITNKSKGVVSKSKSKISKANIKSCPHKKHHEAKMSNPIKKITVPTSSSTSSSSIVKYNGVSKISKAKGHKYEARFSSVRLGSYVLKADAALAYDGYVRSSGRKKHFGKINFQVESDYLVARELELEGRGLGNIDNGGNGGSSSNGGSNISLKSIDLEDALEYISTKVNNAVEKTRRRA